MVGRVVLALIFGLIAFALCTLVGLTQYGLNYLIGVAVAALIFFGYGRL